MTVRAKFRVIGVIPNEDGSATINLMPVISGSPENEQFYKMTPGGNISLSTINKAAAEQFTDGAEFYVDFKKSDENETFDAPETPKTEQLTFGAALEALKSGKSITREFWGDNKMSVFLNKGSIDVAEHHRKNRESENFFVEGIKFELFRNGDTGTVTRLPNLVKNSYTGSIITGWLPSQADVLANDWLVID